MPKIKDYLVYEQPTKYIVKSDDYNDDFSTPVLTAGQSFILGYTNEEDGIFPKEQLPVIIFDDFTTSVQYVDFPFKVKSSAMKILHATDICNIKFMYYYLKNLNITVKEHKRFWISEFAERNIPNFSLTEQKSIVEDLEKIDTLIKMKQDQITDLNNLIVSKLLKIQEHEKCIHEKLMNCIDFVVDNRGKNPPSYSSSGVPIIDNYLINNSGVVNLEKVNRFLSDEVRKSFIRKELKPNDVLITLVGAGIGNVALCPSEDCVIIQNTVGLRPSNKITSEYLYYLLILLNNKIKKLNTSAAQPSVKVGNLLNIDISFPKITIQNEFSNFVKKVQLQVRYLEKDIQDLEQLKSLKMNQFFN